MKKLTIEYTMRAPVSHIGETASTGSYFQTVLTAAGRIPVITGNSIRGQIRDSIASHFLETINATVSKDVFNILYSGGNINGAMKDDIAKAKAVRAHFPFISLMGGGLGDMLMSGKLIASFAYPVCQETEDITGVASSLSWHDLIDEMEFTRTDDSKNDIKAGYLGDSSDEKTAKASTQMRFSVQYMAAGTQFIQTFIFLGGTTDLEMGSFYSGLLKWFEIPKLGGMVAKGFGLFDATVNNGELALENGVMSISNDIATLVRDYNNFLQTEGSDYLGLLDAKEAKKGGKKNDSPS